MAKLDDSNEQTVNLEASQAQKVAVKAVQAAENDGEKTLQIPEEVTPDATVETPIEPSVVQAEGAATIAIGDAKQTVQRGDAAAPLPGVVADTHRLNDDELRQLAPQHKGESPYPTVARDVDASPDKDKNKVLVARTKRSKAPVAIPKVPGYEVLGELGRGAMGVVFKARQTKLNRFVALKMVLAGAHADPHQLARFYTEAEAVASLQHANIVQIYEVGEHEGLPFISIEYVEGETLSRKIDGKPRPPREAAETSVLLASGMAAAHASGIVHRDLKPSNILLTRDGVPKITDFGLAKRLEGDSSHTKSGTLLGSPSYMSPEQARGDIRATGTLSDLYSLGAILYELLTGRAPFIGPTVLETLMMVREQEPVPPTRLQPKCPRDLETICLKCLQKEPGKRYPNCQALADDLRHFVAGEPIQARPVNLFEKSWRWCRRNPRVAGLSASVAILLLAMIVTLSIMTVRLSRERDALAKTRDVAVQRLDEATRRISDGNYRQAQDILQWSDPLLSHADLSDVRSNLETLTAQVDVYAKFHGLLDNARFASRFGTRKQKELGRDYCHQLLGLYDEIESRTGGGASGLPPLSVDQQQLFKEDAFEALVTAALVERELAFDTDEAMRKAAATKAIGWLNRAERLLPGTRALYVQRSPCWAEVGKPEAETADDEKAKAIVPTSAVDLFWHGFANHMRGDKALAEKDKEAAHDFYHKEIADYAGFLQQRPDHFWGYFNWANAHVQLGSRNDLYEAIIGYTACIRLKPDFPWPYNNRGTVHHRLGQNELAVVDFNRALKLDPKYPDPYSNRGLANLALKKTNAAHGDFSKAIALNTDAAEAYEARVDINRKQGKIKEAIQDYGELIRLNPSSLTLRQKRAGLFLELQNYAAAREDLTAILEKAPTEAKILRARAIVNLKNLKEFNAALADFQRLAEMIPSDPDAQYGIGVIFIGQKQYGKALEALDLAIRLKPGYPDAIWAKAQILQRQGRSEEALAELNPLIEKLPEGPAETLNVRAGVYETLGKPDEAAADYTRMIELKPKEPEAYACLARLLEKQGQREKAVTRLEQLVKAAPDSKWAFVRRAEFRRDCGNFDGAEADCNEAARLDPKWPVSALVRASVTAARGNASAAVAQAENVVAKALMDDGHVLYAAACVWSLAAAAAKDPAESNRYAETSADYLSKTLDKGFHDLLYPEQNRIAEEPAMARIRQLPRVRELLKGHGLISAK
jgi:serine/threonine protein kinase/predicted Zn-dependent protease